MHATYFLVSLVLCFVVGCGGDEVVPTSVELSTPQIPRGDTVEYLIHLPLPEGAAGGENYARFYDLGGTRFLRARYEQ